jgi:thioredoxin-related protein
MKRIHLVLLATIACFFMPIISTRAGGAKATFNRRVILPDPGTPAAAGDVVKDACREAAASHKKVLILFHASWCHWCRKLDTLLTSPDCKDLFGQSYVIRHLTVMESPDKKNLENPGAQDLYLKYAGSVNQGIPFFIIMNDEGTVVADSRIKPEGGPAGSTGDNMGYPSSKNEVEYFMRVLHETTTLSADQLGVIAGKLGKS